MSEGNFAETFGNSPGAVAATSWQKASDGLGTLNEQLVRGEISDHEALVELVQAVAYLTVAVGALLVTELDAEKARRERQDSGNAV